MNCHQEGWCLPPGGGQQQQQADSNRPIFNSFRQMPPNFNGFQQMPPNFNGFQPPPANVNGFQPMQANVNGCQTMPNNFNGCQPMPANVKQAPPASPPLPPKTRLRQAPLPPPDWGTPGVAQHLHDPTLLKIAFQLIHPP